MWFECLALLPDRSDDPAILFGIARAGTRASCNFSGVVFSIRVVG